MSRTHETVISLGGSLIVPDGIDTEFLISFKERIDAHVREGKGFGIITGGGSVARIYQDAARAIDESVTPDTLDFIGIAATRMNASFVRNIFAGGAYEDIVTDPTVLPKTKKSIVVGCGWKPVWSSDFCAVEMAHASGAKHIVNLTNISHVYSADPKVDPRAHPLDRLTWSEYRNIIPKKWQPGLNTPFDPVASARADELELEVAIIKGSDLESLDAYLQGESFTGTRITSKLVNGV